MLHRNRVFQLQEHSNVLNIASVRLGFIEELIDLHSSISLLTTLEAAMELAKSCARLNGWSAAETSLRLYRTLIADRDVGHGHQYKPSFKALVTEQLSLLAQQVRGDKDEALELAIDDRNLGLQSYLINTEPEKSALLPSLEEVWEKYWEDRQLSSGGIATSGYGELFQTHTGPKLYLTRFQQVTKGFLFFRTHEGHIGLASDRSKVGDSIWILEHGPIPFVLRGDLRSEQDEVTPRLRLVGEAYVDGFMYGEIFDSENLKWRDLELD
jgi:hypothetical protein